MFAVSYPFFPNLPIQVLHSKVGSWPYLQTFDKPGKACQGQTLGNYECNFLLMTAGPLFLCSFNSVEIVFINFHEH
jgi:hypothetical protein